MKHIIVLATFSLLFISLSSSAQWTDGGTWLRSDDNVNIGAQSSLYSLYVRKIKTNWQARFYNRTAGTGSDVFIAHGAGNGMHIRGYTEGSQYTLDLYNKTKRTNIFYNNGNVGLGLVGNVGVGTSTPTEKFHVNGKMKAHQITATQGKVYLGSTQYLSQGTNGKMYWNSNHSTLTQFIMRDKEGTQYGKLYGSNNGATFGLIDGDGHWTYLAAKDNYTQFRINNQLIMRLDANGRVNLNGTRDATGTVGSGVLEIGNALRFDNNEIITNTNSTLFINNDNNGDFAVDNTTLRVDASTDRVGIGFTAPQAKLEVKGSVRATSSGTRNNHVEIGHGGINGFVNSVGAGHFDFRLDGSNKMRLSDDGKLSIGSVNTSSNQYKLFVEDGILAEKVRVAVNNSSDWSDFVFEDGYDKLPIETVDEFIAENKHLPNVPSADEVVEKGIDVAEMNAILLRQVEELWLHMIEVKKENKELRSLIEEIKK